MLSRIRDYSGKRRYAATLLLALTLLMRVVVPQGYMPVEAADGFRVELCSGTEGKTIVIPGIKLNGGQDKHDAGKSPCDFAGAGQAAALPDVAFVPPLAPQPQAPTLSAPRAILAPGRGLAAPPPPATGPPFLA